MNFQQQGGVLEAEEFYSLKSYVNQLSQSANIGIWVINLVDDPDTDHWTATNVFELLGYTHNPSSQNFHYFINRLVHADDQHHIIQFFEHEIRHQADACVEIRLLTKALGYRWFKIAGRTWWNDYGEPTQLMGIVTSIDAEKRKTSILQAEKSLLGTATEMLEAGGWKVCLTTGKISITKEIYHLLEVSPLYKPTVDNVKGFSHQEYQTLINTSFKAAADERIPFEIEVLLVTANKNNIWVKIKGNPVCNAQGKCIYLQGSIQKLAQQTSTNLLDANKHLTEQNKRLQNFAHIVSHNLRSYSNNLQSMMQMLTHPETEDEEREDCIKYVQAISTGLTNTVNHLAEIVKHQDDATRKKVKLSFQETLNSITQALQNDLDKAKGKLITDFKVPYVYYLPAYLDSIMLNMITNAVKYRHPDRDLVIKCASYEKNNHIYLTVEDNGLGIDLVRFKENIFGMYKTFHHHPDSRGLGLFMTRNQVETLGGSIEVESEPNIGTKFTIKLV
jgi:signal transduction histidine kinase